MFSTKSSFIEAKQDKINLFGIERDAFSNILNFIYSSHIEVADENVYPLMEAANLLQIHALRTSISFYLRNSLKPENCIKLYIMARLHEYHDLAKSAFHFILLNFSNVIKQDEFLDLPYDILLDIISSRLLNIDSEEILCEHVLKWIRADIEERKQHLDSLMSNIDLHLVSETHLTKMKFDSLSTTNFRERIDKITNYSSSDEINVLEWENNYQTFRDKAEKAVIFAIGGKSRGMVSQSVECFTLGYDKWRYKGPEWTLRLQETKKKVLPPLRCARYLAASANDDYNLYVMGGRNSTRLLNECEVFDVRSNQWKYFNRLPVKLCASGAAFLEGELVVVGGFSDKGITDEVWKLHEAHQSWVPMPSLTSPRCFHSTVAVGGYIFALGGYGDNTQKSAVRTCERFDPSCNKWFEIASMHQARAKFGCAAVDKCIYVFGGTCNDNDCLKSVERYNIFTNEWSYDSPMIVPRHSFSVAVSDQEIYCLGGTDGTHFLDTVEKFNAKTKRWHFIHSMQVGRLSLAAAVLLVPYTSK